MNISNIMILSDGFTNLFFFTKYAAWFDLLRTDFCLRIQKQCQNNDLFLSKKTKYVLLTKPSRNRPDSWNYLMSRSLDYIILYLFLYVNPSYYCSLLCGFPSKEVRGKLLWCSELSMSSFQAAVICQFPLLLAKFPLEVPFLGIGSKWHQLPSAKLHSSSSPLMTEKWNGTFNYCPCAMGRNPFWNGQKIIKILGIIFNFFQN